MLFEQEELFFSIQKNKQIWYYKGIDIITNRFLVSEELCMFLLQRTMLCFLVSLFLVQNVSAAYDYQLKTVEFPTQELVDQERTAQYRSDLKRKGAIVTSGLLTVTALYLTLQAVTYYKNQEKQDWKINFLAKKAGQDLSKAADVVSSQNNKKNPVEKGVLKRLFDGSCKLVAEGAPPFLATTTFGKMWQITSDKLMEYMRKGSVEWYVKHHTKIPDILKSLEVYTVEYDLHASLLSVDHLNQDGEIHLKRFMQDVVSVAQEQSQDSVFGKDYFGYLFDKAKKKYIKKGSELEHLHDLAAPIQSKIKRAQSGSMQQSDMFGMDKIHRQDIADLCILLAQELQRVVVFTLVHFELQQVDTQTHFAGYSQKVMDLIHVSNVYFDTIQSLLNKNGLELEELSKQNQGMFTCTYEYQKALQDQLDHIHRYCAMN